MLKRSFILLFTILLLCVFVIFGFLPSDYETRTHTQRKQTRWNTNLAKVDYGTNYIHAWGDESQGYTGTEFSFNLYDAETGNRLHKSERLSYIKYEEMVDVYPDGFDPSNYDTWTSNPRTDPVGDYTKRWYYEYPMDVIDLEIGSEYVVEFASQTGTGTRRQNIIIPETNEVYYGDDFGVIEDYYFGDGGDLYLNLNLKLDSALFDQLRNLDIVFQIIDTNNSDKILTEFSFDENNFIYNLKLDLAELPDDGFYNNFSVRTYYNLPTLTSDGPELNDDVHQRATFDTLIHDRTHSDGFLYFTQLYVDFSQNNAPQILNVDFDKVDFSIYLVNETGVDVQSYINFSDKFGNSYDYKLINSQSSRAGGELLTYEIYNLDYKTNYDIFFEINDFELESGYTFNYKKNLFPTDEIKTIDKYPNLIWIDVVLFVLLILFTLGSIWMFIRSKSSKTY